MSTSAMIPSEVVFAQKATAIVKAAGMDPRLIDMHTFRRIAPIVFCRAYCAIFKEPLQVDLDSFNDEMSPQDLVLNVQLVIDGLMSKTRNPILSHITGEDVFEGEHQAVGVLVGIMFAEGQRMWMEKIKVNKEDQINQQKQTNSSDSNNNNNSNKDDIKNNNSNYNNNNNNKNLTDNQPDTSSHPPNEPYGSDNLRESIRSLKILQSQSNIHPKELDQLVSRINYLENMLLSEKKVSKKKRTGRHSTNGLLQQNNDVVVVVESEGNNNNNKVVRKKKSKKKMTKQITTTTEEQEQEELMQRDDDSLSEGHIDLPGLLTNRSDGEDRKKKKTRPTSAPHLRRSTNLNNNGNNQVSRRLYNPVLDSDLVQQVNKKLGSPSSPVAGTNVQKVWVDDPNYTYDLRSGRRILVTEAERVKEEMRKKREAMHNVKNISDMDNDLMRSTRVDINNNDGEKSPTKPEYPGERTEKSVEEWLRKMKRLKVDGSGQKNHNHSNADENGDHSDLPQPKEYNMYQRLEKLDLVISIEHCWNCEHHNVSLRHDPAIYVSTADSFLRSLAQVVHECNLRVRVGVFRFQAKITPKSRPTDVDSRIGACEIQVAMRDEDGKVTVEYLHSKLASQRWPSKTVVAKRLRAYLSKLKVPTFAGIPDVVDTPEYHSEENSDSYPTGLCEWQHTPLFNTTWSFSKLYDGKSSVQWVFDSRNADEREIPRFSPDSIVRVADIEYANNCNERFELLATVKQYRRLSGDSKNGKGVLVELKYTLEEILVLESQCMLPQDYIPATLRYNAESVPVELDILLALGKKYNIRQWTFDTGYDDDYFDDKTKSIYLSRKTFFRQVRKMSWNLESILKQKGITSFTHPVSEESGDIQVCYNEEVLDWLCNKYGNSINVTALEMLVDQKSKKDVSNKNVIAAVSDQKKKIDIKKKEEVKSEVLTVTEEMIDRLPIETAFVVGDYALKRGVNVKVWLSEELNNGMMLLDDFNRKLVTLASLVGMGDSDDDKKEELDKSVHKSSLHTISELCGDSTSGKMNINIRLFLELCNRKVKLNNNETKVDLEEMIMPTNPDNVEQRDIQKETDKNTIIENLDVNNNIDNNTEQLDVNTTLLINDNDVKIVNKSNSVTPRRESIKETAVSIDNNGLQNTLDEMERKQQGQGSAKSTPKTTPRATEQVETDTKSEPKDVEVSIVVNKNTNQDETLDHSKMRSSESKDSDTKIYFEVVLLILYCIEKRIDIISFFGARGGKLVVVDQFIEKIVSLTKIFEDVDVELKTQFEFAVCKKSLQLISDVCGTLNQEDNKIYINVHQFFELCKEIGNFSSPNQSPRLAASKQENNSPENRMSLSESKHRSSNVSPRVTILEPIKETTESYVTDDVDVVVNLNRENQKKEKNEILQENLLETRRISGIEATKPSQPVQSGILRAPSRGSFLSSSNIITMKQIEEKQDLERYEIEMKEEREKDSLNYQTKDLVFISIIIEGETLEHPNYDTTEILLEINGKKFPANVCLAREKGSKRRSFNVNWGEIYVPSDKFKTDFAYLSLIVTDVNLIKQYSHLPTIQSTEIGVSKNSVKIPLYRFMKSYFEIKTKILIDPEVEGKSGSVLVTIHGHAHEAKDARTSRIMSMRPQDLVNMKFDPLPKDSDSDDYSDDHEDPEDVEVMLSSPEGKSPKDKSVTELSKGLFPKPSHNNLLSAAKK